MPPLNPSEAPATPADLSFLIHTIPDIPNNASIIGLCTIPRHRAAADDKGWYVAAFAAWKALLGRIFINNPQAWLSALDGSACSPLVFGDKCLDGEFDERVRVIEDPNSLSNAFLVEISRKAAAAGGKTPLVVIVCGPTSLGQDVLFGMDNDQQTAVTIKSIQESAGAVNQLMLITPSMLAATWWMVNPHLNQTISTPGASHIPPDTGRSPVTATCLVKMYARRCALIFFDQLLGDLFTRRSLFLHPIYEQRHPEKTSEPLLPENPTEAQKAASALLSQAARQALYAGLAPLPTEDGFFFFPMRDPWVAVVKPRQNQTLSLYNKTWDSLGQPAVAASIRHKFPHGFGSSDRSGSAATQTFVKASAEPQGLSTDLVKIQNTSTTSRYYWDNKKHMNAAYECAAMSLADAVVFFSKLERPQGQPCIRWNPSTEPSLVLASPSERAWFSKFIREIRSTRIFHIPHSDKTCFGLLNPSPIPDDAKALITMFSHPVMYIWQAFKLKHGPLIKEGGAVATSTEAQKILEELPEVYDVIRLMWQGLWQELLDDPAVQRTAKVFLHSLDIKMCTIPYNIPLGQFGDTSKKEKPRLEKSSPAATSETVTETAAVPAAPEAAVTQPSAQEDEESPMNAAENPVENPTGKLESEVDFDQSVVQNAGKPVQKSHQHDARLIDFCGGLGSGFLV